MANELTINRHSAFKKLRDCAIFSFNMKKESKQTISVIQKKLWQECRRLILDIYQKVDGTWECYTCSQQNLQKSNKQIGHFIAKSVCGAYLKYDLRNLRVQCFRCNCNLSGNGAVFYRNMVEREGQEFVDELFIDKQKSIKAIDHYINLLTQYEKM